jgi:hypothetical protein
MLFLKTTNASLMGLEEIQLTVLILIGLFKVIVLIKKGKPLLKTSLIHFTN